MKVLLLSVSIFIYQSIVAQNGLGDVIGTVLLPSELPAKDISVWVEDGDKVYSTRSGDDGRFRISAVPSGEYIVSVALQSDTFYTPAVYVTPDGFGNVGRFVCVEVFEQEVVVIDGNYQKMKLEMNSSPVTTLSDEDILNSPGKFDVSTLVANATSEVKADENGELMFRGSRKGDMVYVMDGVKMDQVMNLPSCAIKNMTIYSGAIPAKYGDTTGGVIVVETKSYFDLLREYRIGLSR
jgi:hypothetical protein